MNVPFTTIWFYAFVPSAMTYARREVWRSWAVKSAAPSAHSIAPTPTYDQGQFYRSTVLSRTRNVCDAPLRPRIPPGHQGGSIFRIRRKQSRAAPLGLFLRFYIKYLTSSRSPRAHRLRVRGDAFNSTQPGPSGPPKGKFCRWKFPASDHRACRLSIRRM